MGRSGNTSLLRLVLVLAATALFAVVYAWNVWRNLVEAARIAEEKEWL
jgi:hypothetical protein